MITRERMKYLLFPLLAILLVTACGPSPEERMTLTATALTATAAAWTRTPTPTFTPSLTSTPTETATITLTPTDTFTPTITFTPSITPSPTFDFPDFTVLMQAHCRYGPTVNYLHAGDLYAGDRGVVWGRAYNSNWLFIKLDKLHYPCWVAPSIVEVVGDITRLVRQQIRLPGPSELYQPPTWVRATRQGDQVTVTWDGIWMTEDDDRGYFIEYFHCVNGLYIWETWSTPNQFVTTATFTDQPGCSQTSSGLLYAVEKHGYTTPVQIPWPTP